MTKWTARARADLRAIHDYIAKRSPINAKRVVGRIFERASRLDETPRVGYRTPEFDDDLLREIRVSAWRVVYLIRGREVFIVALIHVRRVPTRNDILGS